MSRRAALVSLPLPRMPHAFPLHRQPRPDQTRGCRDAYASCFARPRRPALFDSTGCHSNRVACASAVICRDAPLVACILRRIAIYALICATMVPAPDAPSRPLNLHTSLEPVVAFISPSPEHETQAAKRVMHRCCSVYYSQTSCPGRRFAIPVCDDRETHDSLFASRAPAAVQTLQHAPDAKHASES